MDNGLTRDQASFIQILWSVLIDCILYCFAWVTVFEIKSFESKMSLISEFEFLIFSLFESIALCVYLKKDYSA